MLTGSVEATLLLLLVVVVFGPIVAERFRIPAIIGLIFGGVLFGPFVLGWMLPAGLVTQLGAIGILYLMFLAGLGFDLRSFLANRNNAIVYGLLSFIAGPNRPSASVNGGVELFLLVEVESEDCV